MKRLRLFAAVAAGFFLLAPGAFSSENDAQQKGDHALFFRGLFLFHDSHWEEAEKAFGDYKSLHPQSALASIYSGYAVWFSNGREEFKDKNKYRAIKASIDKAVEFNLRACDAEDLAIGGPSIDCEYIVAALFSLRAALVEQNEGIFAAKADDKAFELHAGKSHSPQRFLLLGMKEYAFSNLGGWKKYFACKFFACDRKDVFDKVEKSLQGNESPFVVDSWFFILIAENSYLTGRSGVDRQGELKTMPHRSIRKDAALEDLLKRHPLKEVRERLKDYPDSPELKNFLAP